MKYIILALGILLIVGLLLLAPPPQFMLPAYLYGLAVLAFFGIGFAILDMTGVP